MSEIAFRVWHRGEKKMYYRGYQKLTHVLLCEDDRGKNQEKGIPSKRASYEDCEFMQSAGLKDKHGREIFEGDCVRVRWQEHSVEGILETIPDMFKSRGLHPLHHLLAPAGIPDKADGIEMEVTRNRYENG